MVGGVLIDNGSEGNILFMGAAKMMGVFDKVKFRRSTIQTLNGTPLNTGNYIA